MSERWLPIGGFEGYLEVSDKGRIRSLDRTTHVTSVRYGNYERPHKGKVLKQARHHRGYMYITLAGGGKLLANAKVHHLVLSAFVGPRPEGMECCHANDVPDDNRLENLRWDTREANLGDAIKNGTRRWTHCSRKHEFTPENTMLLKGGLARRCRECARMQGRKSAA